MSIQINKINVDDYQYRTDNSLLKFLNNDILQTNNSTNVVSSYPYKLCYCRNDLFICDDNLFSLDNDPTRDI